MDDKKKKRSPKVCLAQLAPPVNPRKLSVPASKSATFSLGLPQPPSPKPRTRFKRSHKEKARAPQPAGPSKVNQSSPLQHSFLTDVSDVREMEGGLLSLLSDFHSGKLQAFGKVCSFEQLEHVREMQEKLARLHFSMDSHVEELSEDQKKSASDHNLEHLLCNACARGYLVRKKFSSLREEYESIVREIEGDLALLEWRGETIQRPVFVNKKRAVSKASNCASVEKPAEDHRSADNINKAICRTLEMLEPERDRDGRMVFAVEQHPHEERGVPEVLCEGARHLPESVEASGSVSEPPPSVEEEEERDLRSSTELTSVWNSTTQDTGSSVIHKDSLCRTQSKEMPKSKEGLRLYRSNLAMELLWLQQAIASRKKVRKPATLTPLN
ncbi:CC28B protein, partial [Polyodon spathula]|nr:CC28B protein [Polyodon spathula]